MGTDSTTRLKAVAMVLWMAVVTASFFANNADHLLAKLVERGIFK